LALLGIGIGVAIGIQIDFAVQWHQSGPLLPCRSRFLGFSKEIDPLNTSQPGSSKLVEAEKRLLDLEAYFGADCSAGIGSPEQPFQSPPVDLSNTFVYEDWSVLQLRESS
jgi:hypothetical protein